MKIQSTSEKQQSARADRAKRIGVDVLRHQAAKTQRRGHVSERTLKELAAAELLGTRSLSAVNMGDPHNAKRDQISDALHAVHQIKQVCPHSADVMLASQFLGASVLAVMPDIEMRTHWLDAVRGGNVPALHETSHIDLVRSDDCIFFSCKDFTTTQKHPSKLHIIVVSSGPDKGTSIVLNHKVRCWKPAVENRKVDASAILKLGNPERIFEQHLVLKQALSLLSATDEIAALQITSAHMREQTTRIAADLAFLFRQLCDHLTEIEDLNSVPGVIDENALIASSHEVKMKARQFAESAAANKQDHKRLARKIYVNHLRETMIHELQAIGEGMARKTFIAAAE